METAVVPVVPNKKLNAEIPKEYKFLIPIEWKHGKSDYTARIQIFKSEAYTYNGFENAGAWWIALKTHQGKYALTRLTLEAVKDLERKLLKVNYLMDPAHDGDVLPTDDDGNVPES